MDDVRALFFDVGGTVFDWKTTSIEALRSLGRTDTAELTAFADDWRASMFSVHALVRSGDLPWMNADEMHLRGLDRLVEQYPFLADIDRSDLVRATWHNLQAFDGAAAAIERLRSRFTVVVLTILSWESIVMSSKRAGVQWDGVLSCEFLGHYKPSLESYRRGMALLGLTPEQAMMVAAHEGDLDCARRTGMRTAYVSVPVKDNVGGAFSTPDATGFDIEAADFAELCDALDV